MATVSTGQSRDTRLTLCSSSLQMGHHSAQKCSATGWPGCAARHCARLSTAPSCALTASALKSGAGPPGTFRVCQKCAASSATSTMASVARCERQRTRCIQCFLVLVTSDMRRL